MATLRRSSRSGTPEGPPPLRRGQDHGSSPGYFQGATNGLRFLSMPTRPALIRRLPRLFGTVSSAPIVGRERRAAFSDLETDFALLDKVLVPEFERHDKDALRAQNSFRRQQLALILGGASTTILGSLHASLGPRWDWAAFAEAAVAGILVAVVFFAQRTQAQRRYLENRLLAERLRAEFFRFVGRVGPYANDARRGDALRNEVRRLKAEGGA